MNIVFVLLGWIVLSFLLAPFVGALLKEREFDD